MDILLCSLGTTPVAFASLPTTKRLEQGPSLTRTQPPSDCRCEISHKNCDFETTNQKTCVQVGTRVIGLYKEPETPRDAGGYYSGIVAEPPKGMNKYRYLVFFDDGYAR